MKFVKIIFHQFSFVFAVKLLLQKMVKKALGIISNEYHSQTGEDIIIQFFIQKEKGFYVDVGCNHPIGFSNTFALYKKGWVGINIDANPHLIKKYSIRPNDISVCEAVSNEVKEMVFHEFQESAVSTLETTVLEEWKTKWNYLRSRKVTTKTLTQILDEHNILQPIDFLSVDVEGHDFEVLSSLNFEKYRPQYILIEMHNFDVKHYKENKIIEFLDGKGYDLVGFITMNGWFKLKTPLV